jgi:uncharacterized membrane protein YdbT with pleckstrin-like domain
MKIAEKAKRAAEEARQAEAEAEAEAEADENASENAAANASHDLLLRRAVTLSCVAAAAESGVQLVCSFKLAFEVLRDFTPYHYRWDPIFFIGSSFFPSIIRTLICFYLGTNNGC